MNISKRQINAFQTEILDWYEQNKRDLPWREVPYDTALQARDPYKILVSEIMLQQTQVSRVIPKYEAWLNAFPTVEALAQAKTAEVLGLWSGLGYNRRALYLQKAAKEIVETYNGKFPQDLILLKKLPGIGEYTARAVACFAFNQQIAVVDTNVRKVILLRFCHPERSEGSPESLDRDSSATPQNDKVRTMTTREIQEIADQLLPKGRAYAWNQALMDYANAMLKAEKVPVPKQSKFIGSNRYYRGQIIKYLLTHQKATVSALAQRFAKEQTFIELILTGLIKDGLVQQKNDQIFLA